MTRSDNIKEFLKYASPRLDYIDHCMEKQALSAKTVLKALEKFRSLDSAKQSEYLGKRLKQIDDALQGKDINAANVESVLNKRRSDLKLEKSKVSSDWTPPSSKPKAKVKYEDLFDADKAGIDYGAHLRTLGKNPSKADKETYINTFKAGFLSDPRVTQEAARRGITAEELFDEAAKYFASGFRGGPGANARGLRRLFNDATDDKYYNYTRSPIEPITDWTKEHPVATPFIAAGATSIPTAGISYAIGSSNGEDRGVANADAYYRLLMANQASALQNANGDLLSRLANVFGAGDLNKIIDGYYN